MAEPIAPSDTPWIDVHAITDPAPTMIYRSGLTMYEEALLHGQYVGRAWNAAGFMHAWDDMRLDPTRHPTPQAFWLEIDGQLLASHWEWGGMEQAVKTHGTHTIVTLNHTIRPISVRVHMLLDGTPILTRWLEITNRGQQPAALSAAFPWSGVLQITNRWQAHLPSTGAALYSLGYMVDPRHLDEGNFQWHPLPNAGYRIDGRFRRDRHRHPMFVLRNNATGEHVICQLAWSGGFCFEFDLDADLGLTDGAARLFFRVGPDAPSPQRVIAPGETVRTPEVHLGMLFGDLDASIQAMHDHLRRSVFPPQARGRGGWVESGIGPEVEITLDAVMQQIDRAAALGAEVFFIDASWYAAPHSHWWNTVGDWDVNLERFPGGMQPIRDRVHERGMLFGLWMDSERIAVNSRIVQEHPEWLAVAYDGQKRLGDMLDLTNPAAAEWMEDQISRVITEHQLEFYRLDYNVRNLGPGGHVIRDGFAENSYWRYYEAFDGVYQRLRARFPDVIFENCASGGARTDIATVRHFSHTWVTDWQLAPRAFRITSGMTMALPPEYVDRLLGGQNGHITADIDFQARLLLFVRPTVTLFMLPGAVMNPLQVSRIRHMVELYKNVVRPFQPTSRIFHHTPVLIDLEPQGWGVLELAARDGARAIAGVFQLSAPHEAEYLLRPRGLDVGRRYRITWDNSGQTCELDGIAIQQHGLLVRLEGPLTSELLLFEALDTQRG